MATTQEYGLGEYVFPRGWFLVAEADEVTRTPRAARFFGQELVLYRGESGRVVMLDAYCPHMGTHLARNTTSYVVRDGAHVEGDSIRCPYHAWRFGPDGLCDQIPYFDGPIPPSARVRAWRVEERYGCVFAWHDPEGGEPDFALPALPEWEDPQWVRWKLDHLGQLNVHPQEIVDNIVDVAHFDPVHGSLVEYWENEFRGVTARQRQGGGHRTLTTGEAMLVTDALYTGPGILLTHMRGPHHTIMLVAHTPVDDGVTRVWHGLMLRAAGVPPTAAEREVAAAYSADACAAFAQDFEIWGAKQPCVQPLQVPTDGPFGKARAWYRQFYNPRARAHEFHRRADGVYVSRGAPPVSSEA